MHSLSKSHLPFPTHFGQAKQKIVAAGVAIATALANFLHAAASHLRRFMLVAAQWTRRATGVAVRVAQQRTAVAMKRMRAAAGSAAQWSRDAAAWASHSTRRASEWTTHSWDSSTLAAAKWLAKVTGAQEDRFAIRLDAGDLLLIEHPGSMDADQFPLPTRAPQSVYELASGRASNGSSFAKDDSSIAGGWAAVGSTSTVCTPEVERLVRASGRVAHANVGARGSLPPPSSPPVAPRSWGRRQVKESSAGPR